MTPREGKDSGSRCAKKDLVPIVCSVGEAAEKPFQEAGGTQGLVTVGNGGCAEMVGVGAGDSRQTLSRAQRLKGAHHGRDDPGDTDGVPAACIGHAPPVQDVQAGVQHPVVKLGEAKAEVTLRLAPAPPPRLTCL